MIAEQSAIGAAIKQFEKAWNAHDAGAFSALFAEDADFTNVFGLKVQGRKAIHDFHAPMFDSIFRESVLHAGDISMRILHPGIAAVDVQWSMSGAKDESENPWPNRKGLMNLVMMEIGNQWQIVVMHNMDLKRRPE